MKLSGFQSSAKSIALSRDQARLGVGQRVRQTWLALVDRLVNQFTQDEQEFRVWVTRDRSGKPCWSAEHTSTGRLIHNVSEDHLRRWVEQQQHSGPSAAPNQDPWI